MTGAWGAKRRLACDEGKEVGRDSSSLCDMKDLDIIKTGKKFHSWFIYKINAIYLG